MGSEAALDTWRVGRRFGWPVGRVDLALALLCGFTFGIWRWIAAGQLSVRYVILACAVSLIGAAGGGLIERALRPAKPWDFPMRFVTGYLVVNLVLYVLVWILPFGIVGDFWLTAAAVVAGALAAGRCEDGSPSTARPWRAQATCVLLSLVAASLWSQDTLRPILRQGDTVAVRPWADSTFHASQIAVFAASHGAQSIQEPRMAGAPERLLYHYASYVWPALLSRAGRTSAYDTFACQLVPTGVLLVGLAAYALARSWWGAWPGCAACALVLLAPDAAYQGFGNYFLSYHWRFQAAPGTGYGMAAAVVAWVLMFEACRTRRLGLMCVSFVSLAAGLVFKSHMVLPSALPLWVFPSLAMAGVPPRRRAAWFLSAVGSFVLVVYLSQRSTSVPLVRPDFSATKDYLAMIVRQFEHAGALKEFFGARITPTSSLLSDIAWGVALVGLGTLGVAALVYPFLAVGMYRTMPQRVLWFPLTFVAIYLFMSLSLAYDDRQIGRPEELLHRPFPWAYFVLYAWVGGAAYWALWGDAAPARHSVRTALCASLVAALAVPLVCGRGVEGGPQSTWGVTVAGASYPAGLVDCATWVRRESKGKRPIVLDSGGDPQLIVAAFSEAQPYAARYVVDVRPPPGLPERLEEADRVPTLTSAQDVRRFIADRGITWYILRPETKVAWPAHFFNRPAFEAYGYRVYHFGATSSLQQGRR